MSTIRIYDANNYLRRNFEKGAPVQQVVPQYQRCVSLWVFDGAGALAKRRELYPEYKVKRDRETPTINGAYDFLRAVKIDLLPHCENAITLDMPGWEADDVIAHLVQAYARVDSITAIELYSNDGDFLQLKTGNQKLKIMDTIKLAEQVDPALIRLYKTLVGDSSDNIPGLKGFGDKAFAALSADTVADWLGFLAGTDQSLVSDLADTLKPAQREWFLGEGKEKLRLFWRIVGFLPIDADLVNNSMRISVSDRDEYQRTCRQYMWGI